MDLFDPGANRSFINHCSNGTLSFYRAEAPISRHCEHSHLRVSLCKREEVGIYQPPWKSSAIDWANA